MTSERPRLLPYQMASRLYQIEGDRLSFRQVSTLNGRRTLAFANTEHLGAASGANALGRGLTIFHSDALGVLHLFLRSALYTISLH